MGLNKQVKIILIETSNPGNIGSTLRAMKTMGFGNLCLVNPNKFPSDEVTALAANASDLIDSVSVVDNLEEALAGCNLVVATSSRDRKVPWPNESIVSASPKIIAEADNDNTVAILFGREDRGLTNEELGMCNLHVHIPTNEEYSSLNLSQAVQILSYEIRLATLEHYDLMEKPEWDVELADNEQTERLITHLDELMQEVDFYDTQNPRKLLTRVRRFFKRARIDKMEANIFRGLFSAVQKNLGK